MMLWPRSLFARTAITLAITLFAFLTVSTTAAYYFVITPMAKRSADDFAAELTSAAKTLHNLPPEQHVEFRQDLLRDHGLIITEQQPTRFEETSSNPYLRYFREALRRHTGRDLPLVESAVGPLLWVDVPVEEHTFRIGFDRGRLGTNPPLALVLVIAGGTLLTLIASLFEVRRVTRPLDRLAQAVKELGRGHNPSPVPVGGPKEIASLARAFNQTLADMRHLEENRTVMLAGISHDLRTPLTRMGIAIEMLDADKNRNLVLRLRRDLDAMNRMIGEFLKFAKGLEDQHPTRLDLWSTLRSISSDLGLRDTDIRLHRHDPPCVYYADPSALEHVLSNLLRNAVKYGNGEPIDVELHCTDHSVSIDICDRGPGIPPEEVDGVFRPFYRIESSRNAHTGGSGLGLAIARQLAVKHGWSIELRPRDGGGTVARLSLPVGNRLPGQTCSQRAELT